MRKTNYWMPIFLHDILFYNKISEITWAIIIVTKLKFILGKKVISKQLSEITLTGTQTTLEGLKYRKICVTISA